MEFEAIVQLEESPARTAMLAAWVQGLFGDEDSTPVLVGGAAVELYTMGAYLTGDLDFVGVETPAVARQLEAAGFEKTGRHWIHEQAEVFLEFPGETLGPEEKSVWRDLQGQRIRIVAVEDLMVDRLGAWQHWRSSVDGANAFLLWRACRGEINRERLRQRIEAAGWDCALAALERFAARIGPREAQPEELQRWAVEGP